MYHLRTGAKFSHRVVREAKKRVNNVGLMRSVGVRGCGGRASCGASAEALKARARWLKATDFGALVTSLLIMLILYPPFLLTPLLPYCLRWRFEDSTASPKYPLPYEQIKRVSADICLLILSSLYPSDCLYISLTCIELVA